MSSRTRFARARAPAEAVYGLGNDVIIGYELLTSQALDEVSGNWENEVAIDNLGAIFNGQTIRILFDLKYRLSPSVKGRIRNSGVAVGTERTTASAVWVEYTEDIGGWSTGDDLQVYLNEFTGNVSNTHKLQILGDFTLGMINFKTTVQQS